MTISHFKKISFSKYHGSGNDFILIDARDNKNNFLEKDIKFLCHRHIGIGADGIVFLLKSKKADFRMRIFNSDGKEADMCGNGFFCLINFLKDLNEKRKNYWIETKKEILYGGWLKDRIFLNFQNIKIIKEVVIDQIPFTWIRAGVDHVVCFVKKIHKEQVLQIGKKISHHQLFSKGVNVNVASLRKDGAIDLLVYEKGVEDVTFSCGTGAIATAIASAKRLKKTSPITICFPLGQMQVEFSLKKETANDVKLIGSSSYIFSGKIF